jgi:hypothetical protein
MPAHNIDMTLPPASRGYDPEGEKGHGLTQAQSRVGNITIFTSFTSRAQLAPLSVLAFV